MCRLTPLHKVFIFTAVLLILPLATIAQKDSVKFEVSMSALGASGDFSPFWLQNNRYDLITHTPIGFNLMGKLKKDYSSQNVWDYGYGASGFFRVDKHKTSILPHEFFIKGKYKALELHIGAREEIIGNQDSTLSIGGLLFSKNTRPMPKITLGIEHFTAVPYTFGLLEVRGAISHGWFTDNIYTKKLLLHHKYFYARLGGKLPVKIQYGIEHGAQWGGKLPPLSPFGLQEHSWRDFFVILLGGSGGSGGEQINALGNHILSQSIRLDVDIKDFEIAAYWQNISEDGPVRPIFSNRMNIADGLWGITLKNNRLNYVNKIIFEYLNTTDQSGPFHDNDGIIYGGADDYFNNYVYLNGWNYFMRTIGTPFITSPVYNTDTSIRSKNSMVRVRHVGLEGKIGGSSYRALASFSTNYGVLHAPSKSNDLSVLLDVKKQLPKLDNIEIGWSVGADFGEFYGNNIGLMFTIKKTGNLFAY